MPATLSIGCTFSDRIEALLDGRVAIEGFAADLRIVEAQRLFRDVLQAQAYDVAELSMASVAAASHLPDHASARPPHDGGGKS